MHRVSLALFSALILCSPLRAQVLGIPPYDIERPGGDVFYYEEATYNIWDMRLNSGDDNKENPLVLTIKRPESIVCHEYNDLGAETVTTRYVQRDSNVGSIERDEQGNVYFTANQISRDTPDSRTHRYYDDNGRLVSRKSWSFNAGDSTMVFSDSCIYDSTGILDCILITQDSIQLTGIFKRTDRNGSIRILFNDDTSQEFKLGLFDTNPLLVRYKDRDGMTVRYSYNERCNVTKESSEWEDGSTLNVIYEDFEYDMNGNWTRCVRKVKDPGYPPRSTKIIERTYIYR